MQFHKSRPQTIFKHVTFSNKTLFRCAVRQIKVLYKKIIKLHLNSCNIPSVIYPPRHRHSIQAQKFRFPGIRKYCKSIIEKPIRWSLPSRNLSSKTSQTRWSSWRLSYIILNHAQFQITTDTNINKTSKDNKISNCSNYGITPTEPPLESQQWRATVRLQPRPGVRHRDPRQM